MRWCIPLFVFSVVSVCASAPAQESVTGLPADTVVATVDGKKVTAGMLESILRVLPPATQQHALKNPKEFIEQYGLLRRLSALAEESGLDKRSPVKEQLEYNRMVGLAQAQLMEAQNQMTLTPDEVQEYYEANADKYTHARVKVIYLSFSPNPPAQPDESGRKILSESEAKEKAQKLLADARSGADFVKLVKEHSQDPVSVEKDGDFGTIRQSDNIPDSIKNVVFALKPGEVSEPIRQPNGYYLFRMEETGKQPLAEVQDDIINELGQTRLNEWVRNTRESVEVKIENEAFFKGVEQGSPPAPAK